jgi:hypothetical protein
MVFFCNKCELFSVAPWEKYSAYTVHFFGIGMLIAEASTPRFACIDIFSYHLFILSTQARCGSFPALFTASGSLMWLWKKMIENCFWVHPDVFLRVQQVGQRRHMNTKYRQSKTEFQRWREKRPPLSFFYFLIKTELTLSPGCLSLLREIHQLKTTLYMQAHNFSVNIIALYEA